MSNYNTPLPIWSPPMLFFHLQAWISKMLSQCNHVAVFWISQRRSMGSQEGQPDLKWKSQKKWNFFKHNQLSACSSKVVFLVCEAIGGCGFGVLMMLCMVVIFYWLATFLPFLNVSKMSKPCSPLPLLLPLTYLAARLPNLLEFVS